MYIKGEEKIIIIIILNLENKTGSWMDANCRFVVFDSLPSPERSVTVSPKLKWNKTANAN